MQLPGKTRVRILGLCVALALLVCDAAAWAQSAAPAKEKSTSAFKAQAPGKDEKTGCEMSAVYAAFSQNWEPLEAEINIESVNALTKRASGGDAQAQYDLGVAYSCGLLGISMSPTRAARWFNKAAAQGSGLAAFALGILYETGQLNLDSSDKEIALILSTATAADFYQQAAEKGISGAQNDLGLLYERGRGVKQDDLQAIAWIRKAAEQGDATAQLNLGTLLLEGKGTQQSDTEAEMWFRKAELSTAGCAGWPGTCYQIGEAYENSEYASNNFSHAAEWYRKAAEHGLWAADCALGVLYDLGLGVSKNPEQAESWYQKGMKGSPSKVVQNTCKSSLDYYLGDGVSDDKVAEKASPKEYSQAAMSYRRKAEEGLAYAQYKLGVLYDLGLGVPQDFGLAVALYRKAAEQGFPPAQYKLGGIYLDGHGAPRDLAEAYFWFDLAALGTPSTSEMQEKALKARDDVSAKLKPAALLQTQERARKWFEDHPAKLQ
jgi:TPR repeat protein